jgi:hypothetical protein
MNFNGSPLPLYRSHKLVRAAKIISVQHDAASILLVLEGVDQGVEVTPEWMTRAMPGPVPGGYYIVYEDGYTSWSPAKAFEEGYTREPDAPPPAAPGPAIAMQPVKSSNLAAVGYDEATQTLAVQFQRGTTYHYRGVPLDVFQKLLTAPSPGAFYTSSIRSQYQGVAQ